MIIYFSATGNCKYVAQRIVGTNEQETVFVPEAIEKGRYDFADDSIGIVSPTYFWGLPSIMKEFLSRTSFHTEHLYFIATYGTTTGAIDHMADEAIKGRKIDAFYSVRMPDTWTPMFDLSTPEKVAKYTETMEDEINGIIENVNNRYRNDHISSSALAIGVKLTAQPFYNAHARKTSNLHVDSNCIGCGLCAKKCPVKAIDMNDKRPVWVKNKCVMCLGCLHRCPKFSIQYGNGRATRAHGQYTNPDVTV